MDRDPELFYKRLGSFGEFAQFVDLNAYAPVPDDWVVMISDVQGSTRAIGEGRYKDVNMVGAASITAVLNVCGKIQVPFVFGGDGGTLVVPGSLREAASDALAALRSVSLSMFGLTLRIGAIPVADLRARGADVKIRKYELSPNNHLAMFAGGGIELSDTLLKGAEPGSPYLLEASPSEEKPDLEGLSCRWEPLIPRGGRMMTIMVQGTQGDPTEESGLLGEIVRAISERLGHPTGESAPASAHSMTFRWPPRGLKLEARATAGARGFWQRYCDVLLTSLIQFWCERFDRKAGAYDAPAYRAELRANTDFRKFDGVLRMVLDVSQRQADNIENYLASEQEAGRLVYGVHMSDTALMTCLVFSLEQGRHLHFIDGSDGGFAMAARGFKAGLAGRHGEEGRTSS